MFATRTVVVLATAAWACPAFADELHVPSQFPTIAAAVAASKAGDEIILADGEYTGDGNHDIAMPSHALTLRSASGDPEACVIQLGPGPWFGEPSERAFTFPAGVSSDTIVRGITIRDGTGAGRGGGMIIQGSSPTFEDCIFAGNWAYSEECGPPSHGGAATSAVQTPPSSDACFAGTSRDRTRVRATALLGTAEECGLPTDLRHSWTACLKATLAAVAPSRAARREEPVST